MGTGPSHSSETHFDWPRIVVHKQDEFFPFFKERTLSSLPFHFKIENMLLLLKLIYREASAADMPQMKCCWDANADQEQMGGLSSLACCSQTLSIICQTLWECIYADCVETGPLWLPFTATLHIQLTLAAIFLLAMEWEERGDNCASQPVIMLSFCFGAWKFSLCLESVQ